MRPVEELINLEEPGIDLVKGWIKEGSNDCELLPPSDRRKECLFQTQVTTRSPMGAIVYETGGILVDHGWLRFLGSGHDKIKRTLPEWNEATIGSNRGFYLVADDALGGFFAINGGGLGEDLGKVYYLPYDRLEWEPLGLGFSEFFAWSLSERLEQFYGSDRWKGWEKDLKTLAADQCFAFYPFLWTKEGSVTTSKRTTVSVEECWAVKQEIIKQLRP